MTNLEIKTTAFVYDERILMYSVSRVRELIKECGCQLLYSLKACSVPGLLKILADQVDGFSCSSLNESRLSRNAIGNRGRIHLTTPGIKEQEITGIIGICNYVVLNSFSHWQKYYEVLKDNVELGLRINPQLSFVKDPRYDPCRKNSKLGVSLDSLTILLGTNPDALSGLDGIHIHNNCESSDASDLEATVERLIIKIPELLKHVRWINLGGGYLLSELKNPEVFINTILRLKERFSLEVFIEPGAALVQAAGSIVSTVIDLFESDGLQVAILDTTVNHMPEILEYEYIPDVLGHAEGSKYSYLLAGCTCLAGDQFGVSSFDAPIEIGSQIIFPNAGAYTICRANTFNGVNLPTIYKRNRNGNLVLEKQHTYEDFMIRAGAQTHVSV